MDDETAIRRHRQRADRIILRLKWTGVHLAGTDATRRSLLMDVGALMRAARQLDEDRKQLDDPRLGARVEITDASVYVGLSRPTLYKLIEETPPEDGPDLMTLSNAAVARMHAGYGYGGHERVDAEMWARYPHLAGWNDAIRYLYQQRDEDRDDAVIERGRRSAPAGAEVLMGEYRRVVDLIARGPLLEDE